MCPRRPPRHHLSTIGVFFIGNEALQRGTDSGARKAKRTGVSGDASTLQHNTNKSPGALAAVSAKTLPMCL